VQPVDCDPAIDCLHIPGQRARRFGIERALHRFGTDGLPDRSLIAIAQQPHARSGKHVKLGLTLHAWWHVQSSLVDEEADLHGGFSRGEVCKVRITLEIVFFF
jgi:hypothetical protein